MGLTSGLIASAIQASAADAAAKKKAAAAAAAAARSSWSSASYDPTPTYDGPASGRGAVAVRYALAQPRVQRPMKVMDYTDLDCSLANGVIHYKGRKTVLELVPYTPGLHPVGRLDRDTCGLLILTNDGDFTRVVELMEKRAGVKVSGKAAPDLVAPAKS